MPSKIVSVVAHVRNGRPVRAYVKAAPQFKVGPFDRAAWNRAWRARNRRKLREYERARWRQAHPVRREARARTVPGLKVRIAKPSRAKVRQWREGRERSIAAILSAPVRIEAGSEL